ALLMLSKVRFPNSARRALLPPEIIWLKGLNGLNAFASTLVGFSPAASAPPGPDPGSPTYRGVFRGATPASGTPGGVAIGTWPAGTKKTAGTGANSLCVFTLV